MGLAGSILMNQIIGNQPIVSGEGLLMDTFNGISEKGTPPMDTRNFTRGSLASDLTSAISGLLTTEIAMATSKSGLQKGGMGKLGLAAAMGLQLKQLFGEFWSPDHSAYGKDWLDIAQNLTALTALTQCFGSKRINWILKTLFSPGITTKKQKFLSKYFSNILQPIANRLEPFLSALTNTFKESAKRQKIKYFK
jgi:hypothetical protein